MKKAPIILSILLLLVGSVSAQTYETYTHNLLNLNIDFVPDAQIAPPTLLPSSFTIFFKKSGEVDALELMNPSYNYDDRQMESPHGFAIWKKNHDFAFKAIVHARNNLSPAQWDALLDYSSRYPLKKYSCETFEVIAPVRFEQGEGTTFWIRDKDLVIAMEVYKYQFQPPALETIDVKRILSSLTYRAVNFQFQFSEGDSLEEILFIPQAGEPSPPPQMNTAQLSRLQVITPENDSIRVYEIYSCENLPLRCQFRKGASFDPEKGLHPYEYKQERGLYIYPDGNCSIQIKTTGSPSLTNDSERLAEVEKRNFPPNTEAPSVTLIEQGGWKFYLSKRLYNYGRLQGKGNFLIIDTNKALYSITISSRFQFDIPHFLQHLEIEGKKLHFEYDNSDNFKQLIIN